MKTVFITGCSSGIGYACVKVFVEAGWQVAASMRRPEQHPELAKIKGVRLYALDVNETAQIDRVVRQAAADFGGLQAVVNNAGFSLDGLFEAMKPEDIERQFRTNVFGLMAVTQAGIEQMKTQPGGGTIVQISSMAGSIAFPVYSVYNATKHAVEGFTESLQYEVQPYGIRLKLVEPGYIKTDFFSRSRTWVVPEHPTEMQKQFLEKAESVSAEVGKWGSWPEKVARKVLKAAESRSYRLRYTVGFPSPLLVNLRPFIPDGVFSALVRTVYGIKKARS